MDRDFKIQVRDDGTVFQTAYGRTYNLPAGETYFQMGESMHREVYVKNFGDIPKGFHVHHKDFNPWNNRPENLQAMLASKHIAMHAKKRFKDNVEWFKGFQKKGVEASKTWHSSKEGIEWHKQHAKNSNFSKHDFGEADCVVCSTPFKKYQKKQTICSPKCVSKHRRDSGVDNEKRVCINCKKPFTVNKYSAAKNCSKSCAQRFLSITQNIL
jgi:hypothetical protein